MMKVTMKKAIKSKTKKWRHCKKQGKKAKQTTLTRTKSIKMHNQLYKLPSVISLSKKTFTSRLIVSLISREQASFLAAKRRK